MYCCLKPVDLIIFLTVGLFFVSDTAAFQCRFSSNGPQTAACSPSAGARLSELAPQCGETSKGTTFGPMPHVVLERIRNAPFRNVQKDSGDSRSRLDVRAAYMIEGLELGANLMFAVGSTCFLPAYAHDMDVFLIGCGLFVFGSFLYCCICVYTLCEVPLVLHKRCSFSSCLCHWFHCHQRVYGCLSGHHPGDYIL